MAMEYFEEKIAPSLKSRLSASSSVISVPMSSTAMNRSLPTNSSTSPLHYPMQKTNPFVETDNKSNGIVKQIQTSQNTIKKELTEIKIKMKDFSQLKREFAQIKNKLKDSEKLSIEKDQTIAELKTELEDLKRRMNEVDKKSGLKPIKEDDQINKESKRRSLKSPKKATITSRTKNAKKTNPPVETKEAKPASSLRRSSRRSSVTANTCGTTSEKVVAIDDKSYKGGKRKQNVESSANRRGKRVKT